MTHIEYFRLQAKNLFRDYKTQTSYIDDGNSYYTYTPKYFDIESLFFDFEWEEENLRLMKIQYLFAQMLGFRKWTDLLKASEAELELAKLRFDNQDKISLWEWDEHVADIEREHDTYLDPEFRLELFKHGLPHNEGPGFDACDYRLNKNLSRAAQNEEPRQAHKVRPDVQITSLPLSKTDRAEFIEVANSVFESIMLRIEPNNEKLTRKLWDAEDYVDTLLIEDMLPICKDDALSLIDAFLVHHVIGLAVEADKQT